MNTNHRTIKMKPVDVKDNTYIDFEKEVNDKDPKLKIGDHVKISKYKNIFAKIYMSYWSEEVFIISKIKNTVRWTYVINDLNGEEIIGRFYEKELQKTNQKEFRIEEVLKRNVINYMSNGKGVIIVLIVGLIKNWLKLVKIDLSNYATETDIKNISHVDTSIFALKTNLASLKTEVDKSDIDKLVPIAVDLSKLGDVVKNDVVKKMHIIN